MDRRLAIAFSVSLAFHALLLGIRSVHLRHQQREQDRKAMEVIYEYRAAEQEVLHLQRQLATLEGQGSLPGVANPAPQIRIPDRAVMNLPPALSEAGMNRSAVVDLTNLVEAAQGDPVLLSYFSAIREQIQRIANRQTWLTGPSEDLGIPRPGSRAPARDERAEGLVYVSFVLAATGQVSSVSIAADRSTTSRFLQDIALKIIKNSSPFPSFPPSLKEPSRTIVVPLEFLLGSQTG